MRIMDTEPDEALLLALLNSAPVIDGIPHDELADADSWLEAHDSTAPVQALRDARSILKAVIRGEESPSSLAPLLDGVSYRPAFSDDGVEWTLDGATGRSAIVRSVLAWEALRVSSPGRLRPCANDECELFLIDRSKANNARWCSMAVCGNRMKARRHYQRARQTSETT
jgi:hypothetical protein